jgi:hypothetical protein
MYKLPQSTNLFTHFITMFSLLVSNILFNFLLSNALAVALLSEWKTKLQRTFLQTVFSKPQYNFLLLFYQFVCIKVSFHSFIYIQTFVITPTGSWWHEVSRDTGGVPQEEITIYPTTAALIFGLQASNCRILIIFVMLFNRDAINTLQCSNCDMLKPYHNQYNINITKRKFSEIKILTFGLYSYSLLTNRQYRNEW